ncbi:MAG TPA: sodium-dependent symporter family protein, partial [Erysipelotrichaceae bacterium]|nr:sodium-dependent symporter family protein [Erysipelotrichaceae bacterium]
EKLWSLAIRYLAPAAILMILYFTICEGMILS